MTLQNITPAHPFSSFIAALQNLQKLAYKRRKTRVAYTRTLNELSAMSKRELANIGLHQSEIPRVAAEAASMK